MICVLFEQFCSLKLHLIGCYGELYIIFSLFCMTHTESFLFGSPIKSLDPQQPMP